ncbi:FMN-binding glutamate synthase family protein [Spartinivicinus ruber]|uniref:FMN-binding glutamate synthase family protein n=1 Tax=Spartinivicinus ruber TaxID=2683272 RepID=UPI0013D3C92A|nr:FMN-binding glutamate synthase family protein [Spartinivicinus ruber]
MNTSQEIFTLGSDFIIAVILVAIISLIIITIVCYIIDITQTKHAIRRNYPVIGRFRYFFEHLGEFFRQYFFAMDREELPFNRAQRSWVYRTAKNVDSTIAFGSTRNLSTPGTVLFVNCPFPTLEEDAVSPQPITIGPYSHHPYTTERFFHISAMSYGAISKPAVQALSRGAKTAGCWLNTGEGGLSPYHLEGGCDLVFQIGTAKYGVRDEHGQLSDEKLQEIAAHQQVKMFEIKMSQGAKPGKGGILPGVKVTSEIAAIRGIPEGQSSISPNGHPDIKTVADLLDMIHRIRTVTGKPVGFKAVIGAYGWLDDLFALINQRGIESAPDFITIDSADGGTGAAPMSLMDYMGLLLRESLPLVVDKLVEYGLRDRVKVIASGKLINAADVAWALSLGADFVNSARGFMFALGCIQALQCNKNTCPTGITTHNPRLQKGLVVMDKTTRVANYAKNMEHYVGVIAHSCGVKEPRQLKRYHARVVTDNGLSIPLDQLHPNIIATDKVPSHHSTAATTSDLPS